MSLSVCVVTLTECKRLNSQVRAYHEIKYLKSLTRTYTSCTFIEKYMCAFVQQ